MSQQWRWNQAWWHKGQPSSPAGRQAGRHACRPASISQQGQPHSPLHSTHTPWWEEGGLPTSSAALSPLNWLTSIIQCRTEQSPNNSPPNGRGRTCMQSRDRTVVGVMLWRSTVSSIALNGLVQWVCMYLFGHSVGTQFSFESVWNHLNRTNPTWPRKKNEQKWKNERMHESNQDGIKMICLFTIICPISKNIQMDTNMSKCMYVNMDDDSKRWQTVQLMKKAQGNRRGRWQTDERVEAVKSRSHNVVSRMVHTHNWSLQEQHDDS